MSRTMPSECGHGYIYDWGDFGDEDGSSQIERCPEGCNDALIAGRRQAMSRAEIQQRTITEAVRLLRQAQSEGISRQWDIDVRTFLGVLDDAAPGGQA